MVRLAVKMSKAAALKGEETCCSDGWRELSEEGRKCADKLLVLKELLHNKL